MKIFYSAIGVLGALAAAIWIIPAWIGAGVYVSGFKAKQLLAGR
jgi:hypothetical protein